MRVLDLSRGSAASRRLRGCIELTEDELKMARMVTGHGNDPFWLTSCP